MVVLMNSVANVPIISREIERVICRATPTPPPRRNGAIASRDGVALTATADLVASGAGRCELGRTVPMQWWCGTTATSTCEWMADSRRW